MRRLHSLLLLTIATLFLTACGADSGGDGGVPDAETDMTTDTSPDGMVDGMDDGTSDGEEDMQTAGTVTVTAPNGGEFWARGTDQMITWTSTGDFQTVNIQLLRAGSVVSTIASEADNSGSYAWTVPAGQAAADDYLIRIADANNPTAVDDSDAPFSIGASEIVVTAPNGGETFGTGTMQMITWDTVGQVDNVTVELLRSGTVVSTIGDSVANMGNLAWTVGAMEMPGSDYTIRVRDSSDPGISDSSDGPFTIELLTLSVVSPNGGESLLRGDPTTIEWMSMGTLGNINLELWKGGAKDSDIATDIPDTGSYEWTVPAMQTEGTDYRIRVVAASAPGVFDESDADFRISDLLIEVTTPAGGESYAPGSNQAIEWTTLGPVGDLDIALHKGGVHVADIAMAEMNDGVLDNWAVPDSAVDGDDYTIVITDPANSISAASMPFTISGWQFRRRIVVSGPNAHPMGRPVLVQLNSGSFDYSSTLANGDDIRFATTDDPTANGFDIPHWIDTWDSNGTSRIWILMPAITGNNMTDEAFLFYGAGGVANTSDFATTFPNTQELTSDGVLMSGDYDALIVDPGVTATLQAGSVTAITAPLIRVEGTIDGEGAGYSGGSSGSVGGGPGGGSGTSNSGSGGGGYGGSGGRGGYDSGDTIASGGNSNGSFTAETIDMGSGAGGTTASTGGDGGGAISLIGKWVLVTGDINMDGQGFNTTSCGGCPGGGAGGGILLKGDTVTLSSNLSANGGDGGAGDGAVNDSGGGGGGGRIKIFWGQAFNDTGTRSVTGGLGGPSGDAAGSLPGNFGSSYDTSAPSDEPVVSVSPEQPLNP